MNNSETDPRLIEKLKKLEEKYAVMGQDLSSYLDGLLYSDYLTYWDYIHLDTLLSLQTPKTGIPDELIFIGYHQITELYCKLILWEIDQMTRITPVDEKVFLKKLKRVNRYFEHLSDSFDIMSEGMEQQQFLKFRMALLPASGFQSAQIRLIEFSSTDLINLVPEELRESTDANIESLYEKIYWKKGATELSTGKKTLTLNQFEKKYASVFTERAREFQHKNIWQIYKNQLQHSTEKEAIVAVLRKYDQLVNVHWRLAHFKSAVRYLQQDPEILEATGGTNWQKYLPPRFQRIIFFPELWSEKEKESWGKVWVMKEVFTKS